MAKACIEEPPPLSSMPRNRMVPAGGEWQWEQMRLDKLAAAK